MIVLMQLVLQLVISMSQLVWLPGFLLFLHFIHDKLALMVAALKVELKFQQEEAARAKEIESLEAEKAETERRLRQGWRKMKKATAITSST